MKNITDFLDENNKTKLSLINIKGDYKQIFDFWRNFWEEQKAHEKNAEELHDAYATIKLTRMAVFALIACMNRDSVEQSEFPSVNNSCFIQRIFDSICDYSIKDDSSGMPNYYYARGPCIDMWVARNLDDSCCSVYRIKDKDVYTKNKIDKTPPPSPFPFDMSKPDC